jgi:hypothetical protein
MFAKRSQVLKNIESKLVSLGVLEEGRRDNPIVTVNLLELIEMFMEPKLRPLTEKEVDDHILVKQVHDSRKDEVRNYVRNLDYEMKREFIPEDT